MVDVYSPVLGAALAFTVGAALCAVSARFSRSVHLGRLALVGSLLSLLALAIAVVSHLTRGHAPGTAAALGTLAFIGEHPMVVVVGVVGIGVGGWSLRWLQSAAGDE